MATYEKKPDGGYKVRWRELSGRARARKSPDAATAKQLVRRIERCQALGEDWHPDDPDSAPTLELIAQQYLDDVARFLAANTIFQRHFELNQFLVWLQDRRHQEGLPPRLLSRQLLADFYSYQVNGRGVSALTACQRVRHVEAMWSWANDHDDYGKDDVVPRLKKLRLPEARPALCTVAASWGQMDAVVDAAFGWMRCLLFVLRFTGLRKSQAMRLLWSDVDLDAGLLTIRPELGKSKSERRGRTIPLAAALAAELAGWGRREGWLIPCDRASRRPDEAKTRRAWIRGGVVHPDILRQPHHAFRKGFVSGLRALGADKDAVKYLVGHKLDVTGDVYTDPSFALALRETVALIPALSLTRVVPLFPAGGAPSFPKSAHGRCRLREDQVIEIRARTALPGRPSDGELAREYGVSRQTISLARLRRTWKQL